MKKSLKVQKKDKFWWSIILEFYQQNRLLLLNFSLLSSEDYVKNQFL